MKIRITNPQAMIILGRDRRRDGSAALEPGPQLDLRRLENFFAGTAETGWRAERRPNWAQRTSASRRPNSTHCSVLSARPAARSRPS
jgi:hypothetical protein